MSSGLVFMHDAFVDHAIDHWNRGSQRGTGNCLITRHDGSIDTLDVGSNHRSLTGIVTSSFFGLSRALACLRAIRQEALPESGYFEAR